MDLEKKLMEEIMKKREAEKKLKEIKGRRETGWEEHLKLYLPMRYIEDVEIYSRRPTKGIIKWDVEITPKKDFEYKFMRPKFKTSITFEEKPDERIMEKEYRQGVSLIVNRFETNYAKIPLVIDFETLVQRIGRPRAVEVFSHLCQKGSPYHCSFLFNYIMKLVEDILDEPDKSIRGYLANYIYSAGFRKLFDILTKIEPAAIDKVGFEERVKYCIREILNRYAYVYEKPDDLAGDDIERSWEVVNESCKIPEFKLIAQPYDESCIVKELKDIGIEIEAGAGAETRETAKTVKEVAKEETKEAKEEEKEVEKLKEEILKRMIG